MRWLPECSVEAVGQALDEVAPALNGLPIAVRDRVGDDEPLWQSSSAVLSDQFIVKFAWSRPAAERLAREVVVLETLTRDERVPYLPEVAASSTDPVLLVTRRVAGSSLFEVVDSIDRDVAGWQLAEFLVALHYPETVGQIERTLGNSDSPFQSVPDDLYPRVEAWVRPDQLPALRRWCSWADDVLSRPAENVLVHGDLHGNNQVWQSDQLQLVVDFESAGFADPEYDLRCFPGPGLGPGVELLSATMREYERTAGRTLSVERVMAWHLRHALGDMLWRSEAGIPLPDHRTPPEWIDDIDTRFRLLGIDVVR